MKKSVLQNLISKALQGTFEEKISKRYLGRFNFGQNPDPDDIYALALKFLNKGESETCISYIVAALDVSKDHKSSFHLAKTMLFSLSEEFEKGNEQIYKQKNSDLKKYVAMYDKNVSKLEQELVSMKNNLKKMESETGFLKKMKNKSQIAEITAKIPETQLKYDKTKKEMKKISYLSQIEEYTKILSLILEVITFPSRYSWVYKS